ncbi:fluoride efflux transporter FluC [Gracilibacillus salinarum]|uniref:Fluoride-specific ion channel FluC n=1 Tax=Gracilibacillus salinarum TaxID=2932255 RepID=A0ABY4GST2_9BACI|nr:CrcB family protein [Gracilibacillus salinarum]UOQ87284.1 CrcB family protein [Gracilibacillus salinarum]
MFEQYSKNIAAIAVGAALGALGRYGINLFVDSSFPLGTVIENLTGSLVLGFLTAFFLVKIPKEWLKAGLGVGLCGGFTTMSTFAADTVMLLTDSLLKATLYICISSFGGVLLALGGYTIGNRIAASMVEVESK